LPTDYCPFADHSTVLLPTDYCPFADHNLCIPANIKAI